MNSPDPNYNDILDYLYGLRILGSRPGLERINRALDALGHPEDEFNSILVGGTNGKGSTSAFLESILRHSGFKTGLFTSPHLCRFTERIRTNFNEIEPKDVMKLVEEVKDLGIPLTFFEFITAMALLYFSRKGIDYAVLEVGMGGRLDATNAVDPILSIITSVDFDHTEYLGKTIKEITREKLGILRPGRPLILGERKEDTMAIARDYCFRLGCKLVVPDPAKIGIPSQLPLIGEFQRQNAACAVAAAQEIGIGRDEWEHGLQATEWPGRMQIVRRNPIVVMDVAHNPHGVSAIRRAIEDNFDYDNLIVVFGVKDGKDFQSMVKALQPFHKMILTQYKIGPSPLPVSKLMEYFSFPTFEDPDEAFSYALRIAGPSDIVLVTGSTFLVSEIFCEPGEQHLND